jgi:hypothetical protein
MSEPREFALTPERSGTLRAVVERILPGSEGPGAAATDAAAGVERALLHPFFRGLLPGIEKLLDRLQSDARRLHGQEFCSCAPEGQDELLRGIERDPNPWARFLFRSLIGLSLEGHLGDPVHGGNRDFLGWEALGLRPEDVRSGLCRGAQAN